MRFTLPFAWKIHTHTHTRARARPKILLTLRIITVLVMRVFCMSFQRTIWDCQTELWLTALWKCFWFCQWDHRTAVAVGFGWGGCPLGLWQGHHHSGRSRNPHLSPYWCYRHKVHLSEFKYRTNIYNNIWKNMPKNTQIFKKKFKKF